MLTCHLKKSLREFDLELSLDLHQETVAIIGPSGCGKSTTLRLLAGLLSPDGGRVALADRLLFDAGAGVNLPPEQRDIGFVFQDYALFPHMTVYENIAYGLSCRPMPAAERHRRVETILAALEITGLSRCLPAELSGGQQQRVALARALVIQPKLLLLDEPLSALDVTTRGRVRRELKQVLAAFGVPSILVTHDYDDAMVLGDRIAVMDRGRIVQQDTPENLVYRPRSGFMADFSGTNFFQAEVLPRQGGLTPLRLAASGTILASAEVRAPGRAAAVIHPWQVQLLREPPEGPNGFAASVRGIALRGGLVRVELDGALPLTAELPLAACAQLGLRERQSLYVQIDPGCVLIV